MRRADRISDFPPFAARFLGETPVSPEPRPFRWLRDVVQPVAVMGGLFAATVLLFDLQLHVAGWQSFVSSRVAFTNQQFNHFLWYSINSGIAIGAVFLVATLLGALYRALTAG